MSKPLPTSNTSNGSSPEAKTVGDPTKDLNFKVDPDFHFAFKMTATRRKMPMKDLLDAAFTCWLEQCGTEDEKSLLP
jgi:hypothetical protein